MIAGLRWAASIIGDVTWNIARVVATHSFFVLVLIYHKNTPSNNL
jgi:hypothetical protein